MDVYNLIGLARDFADLGAAVQDQLHAVAVEGEDVRDQNPNAMRLAVRFLRRAAKEGVDGAHDLAAEIESQMAAND